MDIPQLGPLRASVRSGAPRSLATVNRLNRELGNPGRPMRRQAQFEHLRASELYCPTCRKLQPVRERLLLVLPRAELYNYLCVTCGLSLGSREVKAPAQALVAASSIMRRQPDPQNHGRPPAETKND